MARRTSFFVTAAVLASVAGCATVSPTLDRRVSDAQGQPAQQAEAQAPQQVDLTQQQQVDMNALQQQAKAQQPIPANIGALRAGMPLSTMPITTGAMAIPSLPALATAIPAAIPGPGASILATFPTLAFGARWVDIYTPLWATSARVAALAGLPPGLGASILTRLHFFGINSHFGLYAPYLHWNGVYRPFFLTHPHLGVNYYPFVAATGAALTPFTYSSPILPGAYATAGPLPTGALAATCGQIAVSACPGLSAGTLNP